MIKLFVALSAVAVLGLTGGCADRMASPAQNAGGCDQVGTTGCKPDPSFGRQAQVGCKEVGRTGCKPDPALGVRQPQVPVAPVIQ